MLPDIARQMREAGLISRDFELEAVGFAKRSSPSNNASNDALTSAADVVFNRYEDCNYEVTNAPTTLGKISLNYFGAIVYFLASAPASIEKSLETASGLQNKLTILLELLARFRPAREIPIAGFLFELSTGFQVGKASSIKRNLHELSALEVGILRSLLPSINKNHSQNSVASNDEFFEPKGNNQKLEGFQAKFQNALGFISITFLVSVLLVKFLFDLVGDLLPVVWVGNGAMDIGALDSASRLIGAVEDFSPAKSLISQSRPSIFIELLHESIYLHWPFWASMFLTIPVMVILFLWLRAGNSLRTLANVMLYRADNSRADNSIDKNLLGWRATISLFWREGLKFVAWIVVPILFVIAIPVLAASVLPFLLFGELAIAVILGSKLKSFLVGPGEH